MIDLDPIGNFCVLTLIVGMTITGLALMFSIVRRIIKGEI